jgi:hypothetical protein
MSRRCGCPTTGWSVHPGGLYLGGPGGHDLEPKQTPLVTRYSLIWRMPRAFVPGSMIQAAQAKPMSAMPSSVFSPGVS